MLGPNFATIDSQMQGFAAATIDVFDVPGFKEFRVEIVQQGLSSDRKFMFVIAKDNRILAHQLESNTTAVLRVASHHAEGGTTQEALGGKG